MQLDFLLPNYWRISWQRGRSHAIGDLSYRWSSESPEVSLTWRFWSADIQPKLDFFRQQIIEKAHKETGLNDGTPFVIEADSGRYTFTCTTFANGLS